MPHLTRLAKIYQAGFERTTSAMPTADRIKACQNPTSVQSITCIRAGNLKGSLHDKKRRFAKP